MSHRNVSNIRASSFTKCVHWSEKLYCAVHTIVCCWINYHCSSSGCECVLCVCVCAGASDFSTGYTRISCDLYTDNMRSHLSIFNNTLAGNSAGNAPQPPPRRRANSMGNHAQQRHRSRQSSVAVPRNLSLFDTTPNVSTRSACRDCGYNW